MNKCNLSRMCENSSNCNNCLRNPEISDRFKTEKPIIGCHDPLDDDIKYQSCDECSCNEEECFAIILKPHVHIYFEGEEEELIKI